MASTVSAEVSLVEGMEFRGTSGSGFTVTLDAGQQVGGNNRGMRPMEMLLVALGGCTGMDVISILRKKRQDVTGYKILVSGVRAEEHPMVYTDITVEHVVRGRDLSEEAVARAVELSETKYCSISAMLNKGSRVVHKFRVEEEE